MSVKSSCEWTSNVLMSGTFKVYLKNHFNSIFKVFKECLKKKHYAFIYALLLDVIIIRQKPLLGRKFPWFTSCFHI